MFKQSGSLVSRVWRFGMLVGLAVLGMATAQAQVTSVSIVNESPSDGAVVASGTNFNFEVVVVADADFCFINSCVYSLQLDIVPDGGMDITSAAGGGWLCQDFPSGAPAGAFRCSLDQNSTDPSETFDSLIVAGQIDGDGTVTALDGEGTGNSDSVSYTVDSATATATCDANTSLAGFGYDGPRPSNGTTSAFFGGDADGTIARWEVLDNPNSTYDNNTPQWFRENGQTYTGGYTFRNRAVVHHNANVGEGQIVINYSGSRSDRLYYLENVSQNEDLRIVGRLNGAVVDPAFVEFGQGAGVRSTAGDGIVVGDLDGGGGLAGEGFLYFTFESPVDSVEVSGEGNTFFVIALAEYGCGTPPPPPPEPDPFVCGTEAYYSKSGINDLELYRTSYDNGVSPGSSPFLNLPYPPDSVDGGGGYNALAYNEVDNYLYMMPSDATQVVRIGSNGEFEISAPVSGLPAGYRWANATFNANDGSNGTYYIMSQGDEPDTFYRVDVSTNPPTLRGTMNITSGFSFADVVYDPTTDAFYSLDLTIPGESRLIRMTPNASYTSAAVQQVGSNIPNFDKVGIMWLGRDGKLYAADNSDGRTIAVDVLTGAFQDVGSVGSYNGADGASCKVPAVTSDPDPLPCDDTVYITTHTGDLNVSPGNSEIFAASGSGQGGPVSLAQYPGQDFNTAAFNTDDGFLYVIKQFGAFDFEVFRVGENGDVRSIGVPDQNAPEFVTARNDRYVFTSGVYDSVNNEYIIHSNQNRGLFFRLDVSGSQVQFLGSVTINTPPTRTLNDLVYNPEDGLIYAVADATSDKTLLSVNISTASVVNEIPLTGAAAADTSGFGSQWLGSDGRLYAITQDGNAYAVSLTNGTSESVTNPFGTDGYSRSDGAACILPKLEKTVTPASAPVNSNVNYTFTLENTSGEDIVNGVLTDTLADGRSYTGNVTTTPANGASCGSATVSSNGGTNNGITINNVNINAPANGVVGRCTYVLGVSIPNNSSLEGQTIFNQGTLTGGLGSLTLEKDSDYPETPETVGDPTPLTVEAAPNVFACTDDVFVLSQTGTATVNPGNTSISRLDLSTGVQTPIVTYNGQDYNALAFNDADGYLYAMEVFTTTANVVRISGDGTLLNLGPVAGLPTNHDFASAAFDPGTNRYYINSQLDDNDAIYVIEINGTSVSLVDTLNVTVPVGYRLADFAFSPLDGNIYTVAHDSTSGRMYQINPANGVTTEITGFNNAFQGGGTQWILGDLENLYVYNNGPGVTYRVNLATGDSEALDATTVITGNQDGAACRAPQLTKDVNPISVNVGSTATYTFTLTNPAQSAFTGSYTDTLPSDGRTFTGTPQATPSANGVICGNASVSGSTFTVTGINLPALNDTSPAIANCVYTVGVQVPADNSLAASSPLLNQATLSGTIGTVGTNGVSDYPPTTNRINDPTPLAVTAADPNAIPCDTNAYYTLYDSFANNSTGETVFYSLDLGQAALAPQVIATHPGIHYNALAYSEREQLLYAMVPETNQMYKVGLDGQPVLFGAVAGLPAQPWTVASVNPVDGHYYIGAPASADSTLAQTLYAIDVTSSNTPTIVNTIIVETPFGTSDIAFSPVDGHIYSVVFDRPSPGNFSNFRIGRIYAYADGGNQPGDVAIINPQILDNDITNPGMQWIFNGKLYSNNNADGDIFVFDIGTENNPGTGNFTQIGSVGQSTGADGGSCTGLPLLEKTVSPDPAPNGSVVSYTFRVENNSAVDSMSANWSDQFSDGRTFVGSSAAGVAENGATCPTANLSGNQINANGLSIPAIVPTSESIAACVYTAQVQLPTYNPVPTAPVLNSADLTATLNGTTQTFPSDYPPTDEQIGDPTPLSITAQAPFECSAGFVEALNWAGAQPALMDINDTNFPSGTSSQSFTYSNADIGTRSYTVNASPATGGYNPAVDIAGNSGNGNFFSFRDEAIPAGAPAGSNFDVEIVFNEPQDKITYSVSDLDGGWSNGNSAETSSESQVIVGMLNGVVVTPLVIPRDATFMNVQSNPDGSVYIESTADMNLNNGDDNATFDVYFNSPIDSILIKHGPERDESPIPDGAGGTIMAGISQCRDAVVVTANPVIATSKSIETVYNGNNTSTSTVTIRVQNQGNVPLYDVQVVDPLTAFGSYVQAVTDVDTAGEYTVTNLSVTSDSGAFDNNANVNGFTGQGSPTDQLLTIETADEFAVGDEITITFDMTFYPDFTAAPFENQATAYGDEVPTGVNDRLNGNDPDQGAQDDSDDNTTPNDEDDTECSALQDPSGDPTADTPVDCNTPTPVVQTKAVKTVVDANGDGIAESGEVLTYTIVVTNISNADGVDLAFNDVLDSNTTYNNDAAGSDDNGAIAFNFASNTLTASLDLAAGNDATITFSVTVKDRADISPADADVIGNQATVDGIPSCDVDPQAQPADCPRITTVPLNPVIGAAKAVDAVQETETTVRVPVAIKVENLGNTSLYDIQVEDRLATDAALNPNGFGTYNADCSALVIGEYCIDAASRNVDAPFTLNNAFDGDSDIGLLVVDDTPEFAVGDVFNVSFDIIFYPDFEMAPYTNQAVVSGDTRENRDGIPDKDTEDKSDDGTDPDPDNDDDPEEDDPSCQDDPQPTNVDCEDDKSVVPALQNPVMGVAKDATIVENPDPSMPDGTFNVTFDFVVENFGNTRLYDIRLVDPLSSNNALAASFGLNDGSFGALDTDGTLDVGEYLIASGPTVTGGTAVDNGNYLATAANTAFDGDTVVDMLSIDNGFMGIGETITVSMVMTIRPDLSQAPFTNQAKGFGFLPENQDDPTNGDPTVTTGDTEDHSDAGTDPDSDDDDDPEEDDPTCPISGECNDDKTPVPFGEQPILGVLKQVGSITGPDANNVYAITYNFTAENIGNVDLVSVQISDPLFGIFGEYVAGNDPTALTQGQYSVTSITSASHATGVNTAFDGGDAANGGNPLLLITDAVSLQPGEAVTVALDLLIYPDFDNAPFENTATGTAQDTAGNVTSDDSDDDADVDPNDDKDPSTDGPGQCPSVVPADGCENDPTPLLIEPRPEIAVNKASEGVVDNGDGSYTASYRLYVQNMGDVNLFDINITDTLEGLTGGPDQNFGTYSPTGLTAEGQYLIPDGGLPQVLNSTAVVTPTALASYEGTVANNQMLNLSNGGELAPGDKFEVIYQVQFRPSANPTLNNQARVSGDLIRDNTVGTNGDGVPDDEDVSDSGNDPEGDPQCDPAQGGDPDTAPDCDDPTVTPLARLGSSKQVIGVQEVTTGADIGLVDITLQIDIANLGVVDLNNLQLVDDVATQIDSNVPPNVAFRGYVGDAVITASGNAQAPLPDDSPNGGPSFFDGTSGLLPADSTSQITVVFTIRIDPSASTLKRPLLNSATVTGSDVDDPTNTTTDVTDSNTDPRVTTDPDPDPDNCTDVTNDPTCTDDPTPMDVPKINAAKSVLSTTPAASGIPGNFDVTYQIVMQNTGALNLAPVNVIDDVLSADNLGAAYVAVLEMPTLNQLATTVDPVGLPIFDTTWPNNGGAIFDGETGVMEPGDRIIFTFQLEIDPDADVASLPLTNQATAIGVPPTGDPEDPTTFVTDETDSGVNPLGPNPEPPENCSDTVNDPACIDDPTDNPIGSLNASKRVLEIRNARDVNPAASAGNFYVTYEIVVQNTGTLLIDNLQLADDLSAADQLGTAYIGQIGTTEISTDAAETTTDNPPTAGALPALFSGGTGDIDVGERVTVRFTVEVDPDADNAPEQLLNQATVTGTDENDEPVEDDTDSGADPKTSNEPEPDNCTADDANAAAPETCEDDPTSLVPPIAPEIGAVKLAAEPVYNDNGTITIDYTLYAENMGNIALGDVSLYDRLSTSAGGDFGQLVTEINGPGQYLVSTEPVITQNSADALTINAAYDGDAVVNLFDVSQGGFLNAGETVIVTFSVTFYLDFATAPVTNAALVTGDISPDGVEPVDNNDGTFGDASDIADNAEDPNNPNPDPDDDDDPSEKTSTDPECLADQTADGCEDDPSVIPFEAAQLTGTVFLDENYNDVLDGSEPVLGGWTVNVVDAFGNVIGTAVTAPDGTYDIQGLPPGTHDVQFVHPSGTVFASEPVTLPSAAVVDLPLPIDPSGVIYDPVTGEPIADAVVSIVNADGTPLDPSCLVDPTQQNQTTGADGMYRFDVFPGAHPTCPLGENDYELIVQAPAGYQGGESTLVPPQAGPLDATTCTANGNDADADPLDPCQVQAQGGAPGADDDRSYFLTFSLDNGDQDVINNHIPLDPGTPIGAAKSSSDPVSNGDSTFTVEYTISAQNYSGVELGDVQITDSMTQSFGTFVTNPTAPGQYAISNIRFVQNSVAPHVLNPSFNGSTETRMLTVGGAATAARLQPNERITIAFDLTFWPNFANAPFTNVAVAGADAGTGIDGIETDNGDGTYGTFTDTSDAGEDPDPDGDGDPGEGDSKSGNCPSEDPADNCENDETKLTTLPGSVKVAKSADRREASIGDIISYTIRVTNETNTLLDGLEVQDNLPGSFRLMDGSASVTDSNGVNTPVSVQGVDPVRFTITLPPSETVNISYLVQVGAGVTTGNYVNVAGAYDDIGLVSNEATATVAVQQDPIFEQTTIIGKVFFDRDGDGYQDEGEDGIPGVRIATVEGLVIETDQYGRYHVAAVDGANFYRTRQFIAKLDENTLPPGSELTTENPRVVPITQALMSRVNFGVQLPENQTYVDKLIRVKVKESVFFDNDKTDVKPEFRAMLAELAETIKATNNGRIVIEGHASATNPGPYNRRLSINRAENVRAILVDLLGSGFMQDVDVQVREANTINQDVRLNEELDEIDQYLSPEQAAIRASERARDTFDCTTGSLACDVRNGYTMEVVSYGESAPAVPNTTRVNLATNRRTDVQFETVKRIRTELGGQIWATEDPLVLDPRLNVVAMSTLGVVNGRATAPIDFRVYTNYSAFIDRAEIVIYNNMDEQLSRPIATVPVRALEFTSPISWNANVPLREGEDLAYILRAYGADNQVDETAPRVLRVVNAARVVADKDGGKQIFGDNNLAQQNIHIHGSRVRVRGVALEPNSLLTINTEQVRVDNGGAFVYEQHLPIGSHNFNVIVSQTEDTKTGSELAVDVEGEKFFMVGIASLTLGQNSVSGNVEPLAGDERLTSDDVYTDGRLAFYMKGKIKGRYLITAQLDTTEDELDNIGDNLMRKNPQSVFRRLDPDRYYPVYGDDSTTRSDVNTQGAFYVKVEWDDSWATWGNYNTGMTRNEFAQYSRSLYGAQLVYKAPSTTKYGDNRISINAFAAEPLAEHGHNSFQATGGSLYYLRDTDVVRGSEKIWIEVRRRDTQQAVDRMNLTEGADYEIDYIQGRIILRRPLTQVVATRNPGIIQDRPLEGDDVFLHVDYEYVPQAFSDENLTAGVSAEGYITDSIAIGGTYVTEQRAGSAPDYTLAGVDATVKLGEGSYVRAEYATSESNQTNAGFVSSDGGLTFGQDTSVGANQDGTAIGAEVYLSMQDMMQRNGFFKAWYKDRDAGFSGTSRLAEGQDNTDIGAELSLDVNDRLSISARANQNETGNTERLTGSLQADVDVTSRLGIGAEVRYESVDTGSGDVAAILAGARVDYQVTNSTNVYAKAQGVIDSDDGYADNAQYGVGFNTRINERLALGLEAVAGDRGEALNASVDWAVTDRTKVQFTAGVGDGATSSIGASYLTESGYELYGSYSVDTDRTAGERSTMTLGQRKAFGNSLQIFAEHQFTNSDHEAGVGHTFGIDYSLSEQWLITASMQMSDIQATGGINGLGSNVERNVVSLGTSYQADRVKAGLKVEYREDKYSNGNNDTTQTLVSGTLDYKANPSMTILGRANVSVTESDSNDVARFAETSIGFAYRPVSNDRFNLLGKYTFLYDQATGDNQLNGNSPNRRNDEKAHIFSIEALYDLTERWELGAKVAYKQNSLRTGRGTGDWYDSSAALGVIRARYHFVDAWDAVVEYRYLTVEEADQARSGALVAVYRHLGDHLKVGVGYNFTDFSDDLGDQSYDNQGWFIDIIGKF